MLCLVHHFRFWNLNLCLRCLVQTEIGEDFDKQYKRNTQEGKDVREDQNKTEKASEGKIYLFGFWLPPDARHPLGGKPIKSTMLHYFKMPSFGLKILLFLSHLYQEQ